MRKDASMRETTPQVFLIARPAVDLDSVRRYLAEVGGTSWLNRRQLESAEPNAAELLVEFSGRVCYRSWQPGLNPNITRTRTDQREYFANLLASAHGSVLEHATFTFVAHNVSRVVTHEWVRHRAGAAYSQESLRYVRLTDIGFRIPPALNQLRHRVVEIVETVEEFQRHAADVLDLDSDGLPFAVKKEVTSALRRLAPLGLSTDIVATMNVRTLRHVIAMRTDPSAEEEIRHVFDQVARLCVAEAPGLFQDFHRRDDGSWVPRHRKV
jgi:thymidylate synthase (FAD)